jgi:broad specificity phosphatase PhoE
MQTLWLVRHAHRLDFIQPEWFDTATYRYDPPLSAEGFDRSHSLAQQLRQVSIDRIYTSPFLRTIQTADPVARLLQLPIRLEWGLCEWLCQEWTDGFPATTPVAELMRCYPNIDDAYQSLVIPSYPETTQELDARIAIIAGRLIQGNSGNILAIAHKGSVLGIAAALTGEDFWRTYDLACGGIIKLVLTEGQWLSSVVEGQAMPEGR